jgi:alcohol dehydrogenase
MGGDPLAEVWTESLPHTSVHCGYSLARPPRTHGRVQKGKEGSSSFLKKRTKKLLPCWLVRPSDSKFLVLFFKEELLSGLPAVQVRWHRDCKLSFRHHGCSNGAMNSPPTGITHTMASNSSALSFQHVSTELRLYCGEESLAALLRELKRNGCQRAVVVTGRSVSRSSAMEMLRGALGDKLVGEAHGVQSNSPLPAVEEVARALRGCDADAVIAVGGGSAAVTARAASILLAEKRPAHELCTRRLKDGTFEKSPRLGAAKLPQFVVPTTPSTAFVKAGSAVLDPVTGQRLALFDPKTRAKALFIHPELLGTSPLELVQSASLNALSTAVEALESPKCDLLSEALLLHSLRLIAGELEYLAADNVAARERMAIAAILCGRGTEQAAGGGLASVLAHAIGHRSHAANGIVNAIVLPHTMRFNAPATMHNASRIAETLRIKPINDILRESGMANAAECIEALFRRLVIPRRLRDIGIVQEDLASIAEAAMGDWFISRSPRHVSSADELRGIIEQAW